MYEETTGEQGQRGGDSSCDDEEEQKEPPPEPTRFGWIQGVMVGRVIVGFIGGFTLARGFFFFVFSPDIYQLS